MSEYVNIVWGTQTPSSSAMSENNFGLIGRDANYTGTATSFTVTSVTGATDAGITTGSECYQWLTSYYAQDNVGTAQVMIVPWTGSNFSANTYTDTTALGDIDGTNGTFRTSVQPVSAISSVKVDFDDGSGAISQTVTTHYTTTTANGVLTGEFIFTTNGPIDGQNVSYSGFVPATAKNVQVSFTTTALQEAFAELDQYDVQFVSMAHNVATMTKYDTGSASVVKEFKDLVKYCTASVNNGKWRQAVFALPSGIDPTDSSVTYGGSATWADIRDDIGQSRDAIVGKFDPVESVSGTADDDPAGVYAGMISGRASPHDTLTLQTAILSQTAFDTLTQRNDWKATQVATLLQSPHDVDSATRVTYGFTFGTGREARINNVRCKYLVAKILYQRLFSLISTGTVRYDLTGLNVIEANVRAALTFAQQSGYIDGIVSINITGKDLFAVPFSSLTTTQQALYNTYKNSGRVTVSATYLWSTDVEEITIQPLIEV